MKCKSIIHKRQKLHYKKHCCKSVESKNVHYAHIIKQFINNVLNNNNNNNNDKNLLNIDIGDQTCIAEHEVPQSPSTNKGN